MQNIYKAYWFIIGLFPLLVISACSSDGEVTPEVDASTVLEEYEEVATFTGEQLKVIAAFSGFGEYQDIIEYGLTLYKITYYTEFKEQRVLASGVVTVPQGVDRFPVLLGCHGTITDNAKAPSNLDFTQNDVSGFELFAAFGFITVIPDYLGFGASEDIVHPYLDYEASAVSSVDMLKATLDFLEILDIEYNPDLFLTGYSQGGYVAMATLKFLEEESEAVSNYDLTAVAAGAGGYNLQEGFSIIVNDEAFSSSVFYLAGLVYAFHSTNDWQRSLTDFFQEPYASQLPSLFDGNTNSSTIRNQLPKDLNALFNPKFLAGVENGTETEFLDALEENSVHNWTPQTSIRLYHEVDDEVVPILTSENTFLIMRQNGAKEVQYFPYDEAESHAKGAQPMYVQTIPWFLSLRSFD